MRLPKRDSSTGRGIATALQTLIGLVAVLLAMPDVAESVTQFYPELIGILPAVTGVVTLVNNMFRPTVKDY